MSKEHEHILLKKGIIIQEENGILVIKTLDGNKMLTKISPELEKMILECEQDMIDALGSN